VREGLWPLVASRLESIEAGLQLVHEHIDCGSSQLGPAEGLLRDAGGAPVVLLVAADGDALLPGRVLAALDFHERIGPSLAVALPAAGFLPGAAGRVLVVGSGAGLAPLSVLIRLAPVGLAVCQLEPFRLAGAEHFAVRWLATGVSGDRVAAATPAAAAVELPEFAVPAAAQALWQWLLGWLQRLDRDLRSDGDRYSRRVLWQGHLLGRLVVQGGVLVGHAADGVAAPLLTMADARAFGDRLMRRHGELVEQSAGMPGLGKLAVRAADESLRASLRSARVSAEEYSALGGPVRHAGGETEDAGGARDGGRIVGAETAPWAGPTLRAE
jgi:hypothetical protein